MAAVSLLPSAVLIAVLASDPEGFALWRLGELEKREEALSRNVGADHSARETLGAYENHRLRMLYRNRDGNPEQHDHEVDVIIVRSGAGTLVLGGTMIGRRPGSGEGEHLGSSIEGGERHPLAAGDLLHIPAGIPHRFLVPEGGHITYVIVKLPAR
jgi:quercetin dioxygenase-like cupin family protein